MAPQGKELFDLLQCQKCHVLGAISPTRIAPVSRPISGWLYERLKPEWVLAGCAIPQRSSRARACRNSGRPPYPKSSFPQLGERRRAQIRAIRDFI
jgi:hypothetical protein